VFDYATFANPDSVITDTAFGKIVPTTGFPRQMQFGLHRRWRPRHQPSVFRISH
jgi:hypothetical protein